MRIVHAIARMDPGGAERVLLHLAGHRRETDELTVVSGGGSWAGRLEAMGVDHVTIPGARAGRAPSLAATARTVRRVVRSVDPDVVHTTNIRITVGTAAGVRLSGRRPALMTAAQGTAPDEMGRAAKILRRTSPVVVGCAPAVTEDLAAAGFPRDRLRTITNASALDPASSARIEQVRSDLGLRGDRAVVLGLGRLAPQKNWPVLIEAVTGLEGVDVVVAGDGPQRTELDRQAREAGAPVRFVGHVDDVAALLAATTCVVSTSDWEGLPLALLEAMSLGVPVVATSVAGNPDHLKGGAVLVDRRDPSATRAEIERMISDDDHRQAIAAGALEVAASWSPTAMVEAYHELYSELTSSDGSSRRRSAR